MRGDQHVGVLSAVGLALAPERHEVAASLLARADAVTADDLRARCEALARRVEGSVRQWVARVRYVGQGHELEVACAPGDAGGDVAERFTAAHRARYGFTLPQPVEFVALRHAAGELERAVRFARDPALAAFDVLGRVDHGGPAEGVRVTGPASVVLPDATLWVAEGWVATARAAGGWHLRRGEIP